MPAPGAFLFLYGDSIKGEAGPLPELDYAFLIEMRASAAFLVFSLCTAFHAPLVLASRDAGMDCCAGGGVAACCLIAGSCSLRSPSSSDEPRLAPMTAFALPPAAPFEGPAVAALARAADPAVLSPGILLPPDPPPRA